MLRTHHPARRLAARTAPHAGSPAAESSPPGDSTPLSEDEKQRLFEDFDTFRSTPTAP